MLLHKGFNFAPVMNIKINGRDETVSEKVNISALLAFKGIYASRVVVEHNFRILHRQEWLDIVLKENDIIEIISFMGGG